MIRDEIASRLEGFIRAHFSIAARDSGFTRSSALFELGYIDSVGAVELLAFIGREFGVEITDADLLSGDFTTIDGIASIVHGLRERANETTRPHSPPLPA
jgi:D-alanine--poly(phosphoribitol) ligase subunit 2